MSNPPKSEFVLFFCLFAAVRVAFYSSAFPFFNNVDEQAHFDLVLKYSHGQIPRSYESISTEAANYIAFYGTTEYFFKTSELQENRTPLPIWQTKTDTARRRFNEGVAYWRSIPNHESSHAPLYYAVAAGWLKAGSLFGLIKIKGCWMLYWIRFLNIVLAALLVFISYKITIALFHGDKVMAVGVPIMISVLPQDAFYSIQSDVMSPVCYGLVFLCMVHFLRSNVPTFRISLFTGLAVALCTLVKTSNLPLLVLVFIAMVIKVREMFLTGNLKKGSPGFITFALCAGIPMCAWFTWNFFVFGDITASDTKIRLLGWKLKPLSGWLDNSVFTPDGASYFWSELMSSFWRGEFTWARDRLSVFPADFYYGLSSFVFPLFGAIAIFRISDPVLKRSGRLAVWSFIAVIVFIVLLSVSLDFGGSHYPSTEHPYFTSGRLISGALIPFMILYVYGFNVLFRRFISERSRIAILILIALLICLSEVYVNRVVFSSHYNLFSCAGN